MIRIRVTAGHGVEEGDTRLPLPGRPWASSENDANSVSGAAAGEEGRERGSRLERGWVNEDEVMRGTTDIAGEGGEVVGEMM